jgi:hypothetical protein
LIDSPSDNPELVVEAFTKFQAALVKQITSSKLGLNGFKACPEGSFFNACANINECFKWIEDAVSASGANSGEKKVFTIGVNCEADQVFNLDAKDPNKYTVDGVK